MRFCISQGLSCGIYCWLDIVCNLTLLLSMHCSLYIMNHYALSVAMYYYYELYLYDNVNVLCWMDIILFIMFCAANHPMVF